MSVVCCWFQALQAELEETRQAGGQRPPSARAGAQASPERVPAVLVGLLQSSRAVLHDVAAFITPDCLGPAWRPRWPCC